MSSFGDFFSDLGDSLTGAGNRALAAQQLKDQMKLAEEQLALEKRKAELANSPDALKSKTIRYIVISIAASILIFILIKYVF